MSSSSSDNLSLTDIDRSDAFCDEMQPVPSHSRHWCQFFLPSGVGFDLRKMASVQGKESVSDCRNDLEISCFVSWRRSLLKQENRPTREAVSSVVKCVELVAVGIVTAETLNCR